MPESATTLLAFSLSHKGKPRLGATLLVQKASGMRPSEAIGIKPEHVTFMPSTAQTPPSDSHENDTL